jgi:DNA adenine methylase
MLFRRSQNVTVKPFLKWAGGKAQILEEIRSKYPPGLGKSITKYAEPFVGGGAVLFDVLSRYDIEEVYISDVNEELIATYTAICNNAPLLIAELRKLETQYLYSNTDKRKEIFIINRHRFNVLKTTSVNKDDNIVELAALLIFLNKTCFNGLYRVNSRGEFNVPHGKYANPTICDDANLMAVSEKLKGVTIVCADYRQSRSFIDNHTFAYFDPPYRPLTATSRFTSYSKGGFNDTQQLVLACFIDEMSGRGAHILASNSDPKNTDKKDDFFDKAYAKYNITRISARRAINSKGASRGKINELLISNF